MLSLTTLRDELRTHLGLDSTDLPNTNCDLLLNRSKWQLEETLKLPANEVHTTFDTVAGTEEYEQNVPVDSIRLLALNDTEQEKWIQIYKSSEEEYVSRKNTNVEYRGKPTHYFWRGDKIVLYPTPDDVYEIQVTRRELLDDLSDSQTTFETSNALQEILVMGAVYRGFARQRDFNSADRFKRIYNNLLSEYVSFDSKQDEDTRYAQVQPLLNRYEPR